MKKRTVGDFTSEVIRLIKSIPKGKVATEGLPWYRVVNRRGTISLKPGAGYEKQKEMLKREGIIFDERDRIDLERYLWEPDEEDII